MRREFCLLRIDVALWRSAAGAALPDALQTLELIAPTSTSRFAGGLFVLALRACADLAADARAHQDDGALDAAMESADRLAVLVEACVQPPFAGDAPPATKDADAASWAAELTRLRGRSDPHDWAAAADAWTSLHRPHRAAYARWRQAGALLATPSGRIAAGPALREAFEQAREHVPLTNAVRELAARARITLDEPPAPAPAPNPAPFGLTERELTVLRLVGEGRTNTEIGAQLFISQRTAGVHVTNILRKLGVGSRVQAATVAAQAGLFSPAP